MAVDPRHVLAAVLTVSMFAMLGNMIKRDHFDAIQASISQTSDVQISVFNVEEEPIFKKEVQEEPEMPPEVYNGPWKENSAKLNPCWSRPSSKGVKESKGYITLSLKSGPEYHMSQIADAVIIARHLGATLVLPDLRGGELGQKRNFEDMYNLKKFLSSLDGVVNITREIPAELASEKPAVVRVPNRVPEDFIENIIEPIFQTKSYLRLAISFHSVNLKVPAKKNMDLDSTMCLAMFGSLELKYEIRDLAGHMVERLRTLSRKSDGKFVAVDLRVDVLEKKGCREVEGDAKKRCYTIWEIRDFLYKVGFDGDTSIYLTESWWHESLNPIKEFFPSTYVKDDIMPSDKKGEFLQSGNLELAKALDFEICSQSDVFVPAIAGMFYGSVTGKRIVSGQTQVLVPAVLTIDSAPPSDFQSPYVSMKNHVVYSCYC